VPGKKDVALVDRNRQIVRMIQEGYTTQEVADHWGITKQRVSQINQECAEEVSDDGYREIMRTRLEGYLDVVTVTIRNPGYVISAGGSVVCELSGELDSRGKPIPDPTRPLINRETQLKAVQMGVMINGQIAKTHGLDRKGGRNQDQSAETAAFLADVEGIYRDNQALNAQLEALRAQLDRPVLDAEIVDE
jgi:Sigma-70, region 4